MGKLDSIGLIGVDGGGTNCRIALLHKGQRSEIRSGATNVTTDLEAAINTIREGLQAIAEQAGLSMAELRDYPTYLGLAGVMEPAMEKRVAEALPLENVVVEDDRKSAVKGALGDNDGSVAGIGTGSFLARQSDRHIDLVGGYGPQLGDEASGAWLGRSLLSHVLLVKDRLLNGSALTDAVFDEYQRDASRVVAFGHSAAPIDYARYAPRIVEAAQNDDDIALRLLTAGANYIERGLTALGWKKGEPLCLMGGLAPHYQLYLNDEMAVAVVDAKSSALDGTLALAASIQSKTDQTD